MKLKTLIISILMIFGAVGFTNAQTDSTSIETKIVESDNYIPETTFRTVRLGIYGGIGTSWMKPKTTGYQSQGIRFAYSYGLLVDYNFTENYALSSGLSFNSLGGKLSYSDSAIVSGNTKYEGVLNRAYRVKFLGIPVLLKLKTNQMGYFTYFAQLGIMNNFRLSSFGDDSFDYDSPTVKTLTTKDQDMKDYTTFYRLSFNFSVGAEYAISQSLSAFASIGYGNGLTNSLSNSNSITGEKESAIINKIAITAGFLF